MLNPYIKAISIISGILGSVQSVGWIVLCIVQFCYYSDIILTPAFPADSSYKIILSNTIYDIFIRKDADMLEFNRVHNIYINGRVALSLAIAYLTFSVFWLVMSMCLIKISVGHNMHRHGWLLVCWSFLTITISLLDLAASGILVSDYLSATKLAFNCLHCVVYPVAIAIGLCVACRGVLLWILNVSFAITLVYLLHTSITEFGEPGDRELPWYKRLGFFRYKIPRPQFSTFMQKIRNPNEWWIFENSDTSGSTTGTNARRQRRR